MAGGNSHQRAVENAAKIRATDQAPKTKPTRDKLVNQDAVSVPPSVPEQKLLSPWRTFFSHAVISIIVGAGVSYAGRYEFWIRSAALFVLFCWLTADTWRLFWDSEKRASILSSCTLIFVVIFGVMGWFVRYTEIHDQQDLVERGLSVTKDHQSLPYDPFSTTFRIWNNSPIKIIKSRVSCIPNIKFENPRIEFSKNSIRDTRTYDSPLLPGDEETYMCDPPTPQDLGMLCTDLVITIDYWTEVEPEIQKEKPVRYLTRREEDGVHFYRESSSNPRSLCQ